MARQVGILDGEVNRNWNLVDSDGGKHLLTLFHDCVTGARAAMLDYEEVPGSAGMTNVLNLVTGRVDIPFNLKRGSEAAKDSGRLSILRKGLTGFSYECELNGRLVLDTTSIVQNTDYEYEVSMPATVDTGSRVSGVTWYEVHTLRKADSKGTLVHRRFRDFVALQDQVESLMKGHHLRSSLPRFPGKKSKLWTNHGDLKFVEDRREALERYLKTLLKLPHVSTLDSTLAFLGMVGNLREFSVAWDGKELGVTLKRASEVAGGKRVMGGGPNGDGGAPPVITSVKGNGKSPPGVKPGDRLFKVNGESTEFLSLEAAWSAVARATRPVMLHFLGPVLRMDSTLTPLPDAFLRRRTSSSVPYPLLGNGGGLLGAGQPSRPEGSSSGSGSAAPGDASDGGSQWSLRGMLPSAWRQGEAGGAGNNGSVPPKPGSTPATTAPLERRGLQKKTPRPEEKGNGVGVGTSTTGGAVGPFGNGAGATGRGRNFLASSRLFGGDDGTAAAAAAAADGRSAERDGAKESLFDSWRSAGGAGAGAGVGLGVGSGAGTGGGTVPFAQGRSFEGNYGGGGLAGGGSRGSSDWMPDLSRGSKAAAAAAAAAASSPGPPPALWGAGASLEGDPTSQLPTESTARTGGGLFSAGEGIAAGGGATFGGAGGPSFRTTAPAWPPERPKTTAEDAGGSMVATTRGEDAREGGGGGGGTKPFSNPVFSSFAGGTTFSSGEAQHSSIAGPFDSNLAAEKAGGGGGGGDEDEEDDEEDDENPFA